MALLEGCVRSWIARAARHSARSTKGGCDSTCFARASPSTGSRSGSATPSIRAKKAGGELPARGATRAHMNNLTAAEAEVTRLETLIAAGAAGRRSAQQDEASATSRRRAHQPAGERRRDALQSPSRSRTSSVQMPSTPSAARRRTSSRVVHRPGDDARTRARGRDRPGARSTSFQWGHTSRAPLRVEHVVERRQGYRRTARPRGTSRRDFAHALDGRMVERVHGAADWRPADTSRDERSIPRPLIST